MGLWIKFFFYTLFFIACQSVFSIPGDFLLLAVIFFGLEVAVGHGFAIACLMGMCLDAVSWSPFGSHIFSYGITFLFVALLREKMVLISLATRFFGIFGFVLFHGLVLFGWYLLFGYDYQSFPVYLRMLLEAMLVNALLGVFWIPCLQFYTNFDPLQIFAKKKISFRKESPWS
ncbi:MAG: hypothetical protein Q7S68_01165 [Deltaproteobacteria bacterium]|nr:hypothetical protein [Deltaproteobacteria bacterium]